MPHVPLKLDSIEAIKRLAKLIKREKGIKHTAALDEAARRGGYVNYAHALGSLDVEPQVDGAHRPANELEDEHEHERTPPRSAVVRIPTALLKLESRSHIAVMTLLLGASARDPGGVARVSIADVSEALLRGPRWRHKKELVARVHDAVDAARALGITVDYEVSMEWPDDAQRELSDVEDEDIPPRSVMRH